MAGNLIVWWYLRKQAMQRLNWEAKSRCLLTWQCGRMLPREKKYCDRLWEAWTQITDNGFWSTCSRSNLQGRRKKAGFSAGSKRLISFHHSAAQSKNVVLSNGSELLGLCLLPKELGMSQILENVLDAAAPTMNIANVGVYWRSHIYQNLVWEDVRSARVCIKRWKKKKIYIYIYSIISTICIYIHIYLYDVC